MHADLMMAFPALLLCRSFWRRCWGRPLRDRRPRDRARQLGAGGAASSTRRANWARTTSSPSRSSALGACPHRRICSASSAERDHCRGARRLRRAVLLEAALSSFHGRPACSLSTLLGNIIAGRYFPGCALAMFIPGAIILDGALLQSVGGGLAATADHVFSRDAEAGDAAGGKRVLQSVARVVALPSSPALLHPPSGDPTALVADHRANAQIIANVRRNPGLDLPLPRCSSGAI